MKEVKQLLTAYDQAKYPFLEQASQHVRGIGIDISDFEEESDFYAPFLDRAENRVKSALLDMDAFAKSKPIADPKEYELELFSFPIAIILAVGSDDKFIKSRYALAEAKRASELLKDENKAKLFEISKIFDWDVQLLDDISLLPDVFTLGFQFFLKNSTGFHDSNWKLVNQRMINGRVYLNEHKLSRLLEEEIRQYIENRLDVKINYLPPVLMERVNKLRELAAEKQEQIKREQMPDRVVLEAFPPCIQDVYERVSAARPVSHLGRFALTSFMLSIGMSSEDVFNFFRSVSDFNERMTRYQIEHIAGTRGSGTKYTPPNCTTLRTHGVCINRDNVNCPGAVNPLVCYKRRLKNFPEESIAEDSETSTKTE